MDKGEVCSLLGQLSLEVGDSDRALEYFREALQLTKGDMAKRDIESALQHLEGRRGSGNRGKGGLEAQLVDQLADDDDNIAEHLDPPG